MRWMEFGKCHLFFSCGIMKFLLFLLFLFLLFDNPQGSTISHKRSIRALNSSLLTNFSGTYARINPCTNAKIETTSYLASHEFRHHTQENNWNDYMHKCSSIIISFLRALGNLIHFSHKQSGVLNFHMNTSISRKQDGHCETGKRTSCDTLPVITIEATDCETSPGLPCGNLPDGEQLSKNESNFGQERKESFCEDSSSESQTAVETFQVTSNFNKDSALNKPQCRTEDEIASVPFLDAAADKGGSKLPEAGNALILDDAFLLGTKMRTSSEPESLIASALMETENSSKAINDSSENVLPTYQTEQNPDFFRSSVKLTSQIDQEKYGSSGKTDPETFTDSEKLKTKSSKSFNQPNSSRPYYSLQTSHFGLETAPRPAEIVDVEESFYSNQPSHLLFREQRPNAYSKQLFDYNLNNQVPGPGPNEFLPNQEPDKSFIFPDKSPAAIFSPQELLPTVTQQPETEKILEMYPFSLQEQTQRAVKKNKELFQQSLQFGKQPDSLDETQMLPNTNIFSETETTSYPSEKVESEEIPFSQIANAQFPQVSDLIPKTRQFVRDDDQTPALEFSTSYPILSAQEPPIKNSQEFTPDDYDSDETAKEKDQAVIYPDELPKEQPAFESNSGVPKSIVNFSPDIDQGITSSDKPSSFNIGNPLADPLSKYSRTEKTFDEANESPVLISEPQQSVHYHPQENLDDNSTDFVTEADLSLPSDQYQSAVRPESQSLVNYLDQYDNVEEAKQMPENTSNADPELTVNKPSYSTRSFSPQYPAVTNSDQDFTPFAPAYESSSNFEPFLPSGDKTFSDEYLTELPPDQDSFENPQQILTAFDQPSFSKTPFPFPPERKLTLSFPNQLLNDDVTKFIPYDPSAVNSEQSSIDVHTSRSPATASFDDRQDSSYSIEPSFTTSVQHFDDDNYDSTEKTYFIDDQKTYSKGSQPTIPTVSSTDELEEQSSSYSNQSPDETLEQLSSYPEMLAQNYDIPKLQPDQILQKSLSEPVLDQRHSNLPTEQSEAENSTSYDSEVQPDFFVPQTEQYSSKDVLSEQNPAPTPYFDEDFSQEQDQTISSPPSLIRNGNEEFFPNKPSFVNIETTLSPDFSDSGDYFEPVTANGYQKPDSQAEFSTDFDARPENFSFDSSTTPLPPVSFQSEDFSFPSNYRTFSENPLAQTQVKESSTSLDEPPVVQSLPRQLEELIPPFSAPVREVSKFGLDFQVEKYLKQPFEPAATAGATRQSNIPTYGSQNEQVSSYADAPEADAHQLTEKLAEIEPYNYSASDLDNSESPFGTDLQPGEVLDQESTIQDYSERFSNFQSTESSPDFSPSTGLSLNPNDSDSPKEQIKFYLNSQQIKPSSYVSESPPLTDNDQLNPLELQSSSVPQSQPESIPSFPDDKILSAFSHQNPLDIPSQTDPTALMENQELQPNDFRIPNSLVITPYTAYPQDIPKDSHGTTSSADFDSTVSDESQLINRNTYKEMKLTPNEKFLPSSPQNQPPVYEYSYQTPSPYSGTNFAFESQPQTSIDEYPEITPTAETGKPFDADETTPSMLKISPSYIDEGTESQYIREKTPDYSSFLTAKPQQKPQPQPAFDYLKNVPGEEMAERTILLAPETESFFEDEPERFVANGPTPPFTKTHARDSASTGTNRSTKYEPKPKESDYLDTNFNVPTPDLNNPIQDQKFSFTSPQSDSVPSIQSNSDVFTSLPQPSAFTFQQLNNTSSRDIAIPLRYLSKEHSGRETSVKTSDKVSPQFLPATAVNYYEEAREFSPTTKPQPQLSLDFMDQLSYDNIQEKLSDSSNRRYQVTSSAALSPEFETDPLVSFPSPSIRKIIPNFDTSDNDALQSQTTQLDDITVSSGHDRVQNNFDPSLPSRIPDFSSQAEPILKTDHRQTSAEYPQNPSIDPVIYDRFSPNVSPREQKHFSEPFPSPQEQRLTSLNNDQQYSDPREKLQARNPPQISQKRHQNTFDVPSINIKEYQTPATVSRHSATQNIEPQLYPMDSPNQYFNYNARALSYDPPNDFYNNKPESQTSSEYSASDDDQQSEGSLERPLPFNLAPYSRNFESERSTDQTTENADSPTYSDYDQVVSSQLPNEELLEYDEDITQNLDGGNSEMVRPHEQQSSVAVEEEPRESSWKANVFQPETESPLGFNQKTVLFDFQDGPTPNSEPPSFPSPPVQKESRSNPLLETLESHLTSPFHEHLSPYAFSSSFSNPERESLNDSFSIDPQNQNEFRDSSAISPYTDKKDSELDFVNNQGSEPISGVETAQGIMNTPQLDSHALVSELNIPSSKSGENCIECFGTNPTHPVYPFDPLILKGNMTAPSYYILVSKLPVDNDEEERFKVEKIYLGDGIPFNCTLSDGQTFPTSLYAPIPLSAAGTVKFRTKSDFA